MCTSTSSPSTWAGEAYTAAASSSPCPLRRSEQTERVDGVAAQVRATALAEQEQAGITFVVACAVIGMDGEHQPRVDSAVPFDFDTSSSLPSPPSCRLPFTACSRVAFSHLQQQPDVATSAARAEGGRRIELWTVRTDGELGGGEEVEGRRVSLHALDSIRATRAHSHTAATAGPPRPNERANFVATATPAHVVDLRCRQPATTHCRAITATH